MQVRPLIIVAVMVLVGGCSDAETATSSTVTEPLTTTTVVSTLALTTTTLPTTATSTPTTAVPTTTSSTTTTTLPVSPSLEVTDPEYGAIISTLVYTFRGVTDPGCLVSVGDRYYADVDADGTWTLDLKLRVGGNTTTITASDPTGMTTKAQIAVDYVPDLTLRPDGLGPFDFGDRTATVMVPLQDVLGPPSPGEEYPYFDHPLRHVYWEDVGLAVVFSDYGFFRDDGHEHLVGWRIQSPSIGLLAGGDDGGASTTLRTAKGIGIGSTLAELQSAYPERVVLEAECGDEDSPPTAAYVRFSEPDRGRPIVFRFDRYPLEASSLIALMSAGAGPGC